MASLKMKIRNSNKIIYDKKRHRLAMCVDILYMTEHTHIMIESSSLASVVVRFNSTLIFIAASFIGEVVPV